MYSPAINESFDVTSLSDEDRRDFIKRGGRFRCEWVIAQSRDSTLTCGGVATRGILAGEDAKGIQYLTVLCEKHDSERPNAA